MIKVNTLRMWWDQLQIECPGCFQTWKLEQADRPKVGKSKSDSDAPLRYHVKCQTANCGFEIEVFPPCVPEPPRVPDPTVVLEKHGYRAVRGASEDAVPIQQREAVRPNPNGEETGGAAAVERSLAKTLGLPKTVAAPGEPATLIEPGNVVMGGPRRQNM